MESRIEYDITACKILWERFSPKSVLSDLWEYRSSFLDAFGFPLHFVVLSENGTETGLLPLWHQTEQGRYLWLGDLGDECDWQEDAVFWGNARELLAAAPRPLRLTCLTPEAAASVSCTTEMEPKCVLPLAGFASSEDYLMSIPKKLRSNLRRDRKRMEEAGMKIVEDRFEDFDVLVRLNTAVFEDSPLHERGIVEAFRNFIVRGKDDAPYRSHMLTAEVGGEIAAVDCIFVYREIAYSMLCGSDTKRFSGVGNAMQLVDIDYALRLGVHTLDFAEADFDAPKLKLYPSRKQYVYESP